MTFFLTRHGIDLDNPGPGNNSVSFLAANIANAAYADGTMDPNAMSALGALGSSLSVSVAAAYSDSGDSNGERSVDNATPPMHYLTPHVEISMADNETYSPGQTNHLGNSGELELYISVGIFVFLCTKVTDIESYLYEKRTRKELTRKYMIGFTLYIIA